MSAEISISHNQLIGCDSLIEALRTSGVNARVSSNISTMQGKTEQGCSARFTLLSEDTLNKTHTVSNVWNIIRYTHPFISCAHLQIPGKFEGCILDWLQPSTCPGFKN